MCSSIQSTNTARAHYTRKVESVKKSEHGRTVKVKETLCVYVAPKKKAATTAPASPPKVETVVEVEVHRLRREAEARQERENREAKERLAKKEAEKHKEEVERAEREEAKKQREEVVKKELEESEKKLRKQEEELKREEEALKQF